MKYTLSEKYPKKRAFITGAASGFGQALSYELAKDGWQIAMADINEEGLQTTKKEIERLGGTALSFVLDVANKVQYETVFNNYMDTTDGIDILFNNAGVGDGGAFEEYGLDNWEWLIGINLMSVVYGCHFFLPVFKQQKAGCIVNTASAAAIACAPEMGAYNTTKAAVVAISETLYGELMPHNIHVSSVQPWFFKTNVIQHARGGEEVRKAAKKMIDKSGLTAQEVAETVLHEVGKEKLYVILPKIGRRMWHMKRLIPTKFRKRIVATWYKQHNRKK